MTSKEARLDRMFLRNTRYAQGRWGMPLVRKQAVETAGLSLISFNDTRLHDIEENTCRGVHFFVDDSRFNCVYKYPERYLERLGQYSFVLTPDFSLYGEMRPWRQIESVAKNRWCGNYWQEHGLTVVPTISWSNPSSFDFCFDGVEKGSLVAVSTLGCKGCKRAFLRGYDAMMERLVPEAVICFGSPFDNMKGNLIVVDYIASRRRVR